MKTLQKNKNPLVSVIIPAHNGGKYIGESIESVLMQDYPHFEIWVVDNKSSDHTKKVVDAYPQVHYIYSETADTCLARNKGILSSHGEYVTFLDQDDTWVKNKLNLQIEFLKSNPKYAAVVGFQKMFLEKGCQKPHWLKEIFLNQPQPGYLPSALMVRRSVLIDMGCFDSSFSFASDVAWFFKARHEGVLVGHLDDVLVNRRIHGENTSEKYKVLQHEILSVIKNSLQNRRKNL